MAYTIYKFEVYCYTIVYSMAYTIYKFEVYCYTIVYSMAYTIYKFEVCRYTISYSATIYYSIQCIAVPTLRDCTMSPLGLSVDTVGPLLYTSADTGGRPGFPQ